MTSKEALDFIIEDYQHSLIERYYKTDISKSMRDKLYKKYEDKFKIIEEDLEVLEIFKKINFETVKPFNTFNTMYPQAITVKFTGDNITEEEYEKWLKWRKKQYEQQQENKNNNRI